MLLNVICKTGNLQVLEEGIIRVQAPFGRIVWQVPCSAVIRITSKDGFTACDISIYTEQNCYQADIVSKSNAPKLYALFPHLEIGATEVAQKPQQVKKGRHWYQDPSKRTYIATYTNEKEMQRMW